MLKLPTVLLRHASREGTHYDWLLADPVDPEGPLWTARLPLPSRLWAAAKRFPVTPIGRHRRVYLRFQGDIGAGRGEVQRVDQGSYLPLMWTDHRCRLLITMRHFRGTVTLDRVTDTLWQARAEPAQPIRAA